MHAVRNLLRMRYFNQISRHIFEVYSLRLCLVYKTKPAAYPAGTKMFLVGGEIRRCRSIPPRQEQVPKEVDADLPPHGPHRTRCSRRHCLCKAPGSSPRSKSATIEACSNSGCTALAKHAGLSVPTPFTSPSPAYTPSAYFVFKFCF